MSSSSSSTSAIPTRARHITFGFVLGLAVIMYVDRVSLGQAAPFITAISVSPRSR